MIIKKIKIQNFNNWKNVGIKPSCELFGIDKKLNNLINDEKYSLAKPYILKSNDYADTLESLENRISGTLCVLSYLNEVLRRVTREEVFEGLTFPQICSRIDDLKSTIKEETEKLSELEKVENQLEDFIKEYSKIQNSINENSSKRKETAMEKITITTKEYERLMRAYLELQALENWGVDNWRGYESALEAYYEEQGEFPNDYKYKKEEIEND